MAKQFHPEKKNKNTENIISHYKTNSSVTKENVWFGHKCEPELNLKLILVVVKSDSRSLTNSSVWCQSSELNPVLSIQINTDGKSVDCGCFPLTAKKQSILEAQVKSSSAWCQRSTVITFLACFHRRKAT